MPQREPLLGIRLVEHWALADKSPKPDPIPFDIVSFDLVIEPFSKEGPKAKGMFVTNPKIREVIQKVGIPPQSGIGYMAFTIDHSKKIITSDTFYPLGGLVIRSFWRKHPKQFFFEKTGLASFAEYLVERSLLRRYPSYSIQSTKSYSGYRKSQLNKRKRTAGVLIPLREAVRLSRDYVAKGMKEYRQRRSQSLQKRAKKVYKKALAIFRRR